MKMAMVKMVVTMSDSMNSRATVLGLCRDGAMVLSLLAVVCARPSRCAAQATVEVDFAAQKADAIKAFRARVAPFVSTYCIPCHSNRRPTEAGVNFSPALKKPGDAAFSQQWKKALASVKTHDMPPEYANKQPSDVDRQMFLDWLGRVKYLSQKDPGPFVIRRFDQRGVWQHVAGSLWCLADDCRGLT